MDRDHRGVLFLAPEPATGLSLDDDGPLIVEAERPLHRRVDVVRALERAVDVTPPSARGIAIIAWVSM